MGICGGSVDRRLMSSALQKVPGPPWGFFDKDVEGDRVEVLEGSYTSLSRRGSVGTQTCHMCLVWRWNE